MRKYKLYVLREDQWLLEVMGSLQDCIEDFFYYQTHARMHNVDGVRLEVENLRE